MTLERCSLLLCKGEEQGKVILIQVVLICSGVP